jgi:2-C-methyl-D-erythritol 4-phosphate cytidylyltransferase
MFFREVNITIHTIILAGGRSSRLPGETVKQFRRVAGDRMLITYSLEAFVRHPMTDNIVVVTEDEGWEELVLHDMTKRGIPIGKIQRPFWKARIYDRQHSVLEGIRAAYDWKTFKGENDIDASDIVVIHDASRPIVSEEMITACIRSLDGHDAVVPMAAGEEQTPAVFMAKKYYAALDRALSEKDIFTQDSARLSDTASEYGLNVEFIKGDDASFNITNQDDWNRFEHMITGNK